MIEIGSDEFPFRLEMFFKNNTEIDVRALMAADLGDFTPEDLLYEFYTRTTAEIADMKRDKRYLEARNPQTFKDIIVKREECALIQSKIVEMEKELQNLRERSRLVKEIRRLTKSKKAAAHYPQSPTELGKCVTLPDIHQRSRVQVLRVHDIQPPQTRRHTSILARDSHSTPSLPAIKRPLQQPIAKYVNERAVFCGQGVNRASHLTLENKRAKSLTIATERKVECSPMKNDIALPNIRSRRNVPGYCRAQNMHA